MLAHAADEPAAQVTPDVVFGSHTDLDDLRRAAKGATVLTFDHEHVPTAFLETLQGEGVNVQPPPSALIYAQDKTFMRRKLKSIGAPVPGFADIRTVADVERFAAETGSRVVLKAVRGGYDGRGVWITEDLDEARAVAAEQLAAGVDLLAEERIDMRRELSAMVARSPFGQGAAWPVVETIQRHGQCAVVLAPAPGLDDEVDRPQVGAAGDPPGGEPAQLEPRGGSLHCRRAMQTPGRRRRGARGPVGHGRALVEQLVESRGAGTCSRQGSGGVGEHAERFAGGDRGEDEQGTHGRARIRRRGQRGSGECRDPGDDEHRCGREGPAAGLPTRGGPQLLVRGAQPGGCGAGAADGAQLVGLGGDELRDPGDLAPGVEHGTLGARLEPVGDDGEFLVEELLSDRRGVTPPADVRCYMFQGECGFILVEDHIAGPAAASYFNGDFSPMTDVHDRFGVHPGVTHLEAIVDEAEPPEGAEALLAVARRVSTAVPSAFCRVDLYDTPAGPVLGEITFYPGTFFYKNRKLMAPEEAARLGKMWEAAEKRLAGSLLNDAPKRN